MFCITEEADTYSWNWGRFMLCSPTIFPIWRSWTKRRFLQPKYEDVCFCHLSDCTSAEHAERHLSECIFRSMLSERKPKIIRAWWDTDRPERP